MRVTACQDQVIHSEIQYLGEIFCSSFVYVQPNKKTSKDMFWTHMTAMSVGMEKPCLVLWDFYDIGFVGERRGGSSDCLDIILKFRER